MKLCLFSNLCNVSRLFMCELEKQDYDIEFDAISQDDRCQSYVLVLCDNDI